MWRAGFREALKVAPNGQWWLADLAKNLAAFGGVPTWFATARTIWLP